MSDEYELLKKRFIELAKKSDSCGIFTFTDFLGLAEQSAFSEIEAQIRRIPYTVFGGAEGTERVMLRFGSNDELGYDVPFPIKVIRAEPQSQKFADRLTHRDFLGAILNLGIERRCIGDIAIIDNVGYIFVKEDIASFIISDLNRIKHTTVIVSEAENVPIDVLYKTEKKRYRQTVSA